MQENEGKWRKGRGKNRDGSDRRTEEHILAGNLIFDYGLGHCFFREEELSNARKRTNVRKPIV